MPIYDYRCSQCGLAFELLVRASSVPACPGCGGAQLEKQLSLTAPQGQSAALLAKARSQAAREGHFSHYPASERPGRKP